MKIRKLLIIIVSVIILLMFGLISSVSYNMGVSYGEKNAETIRKSRITNSLVHEKIIKSVNAININNTNLQSEIKSSGRVVSLNNITISSEVQGRLIGENTFKKGTEINKGNIIFTVKNTDLKLLIDAKKSQFMSLISSTLADIKLDFKSEYYKWISFFNKISLDKNLPDFPIIEESKEKNYIIARSILSEYLSIKSDEEKLKKYTVVAPFDGIITKSYSDVGGNVNPGSPVVDFIRKGDMEVELTVNTSEIDFISIGDKVTFTEHEESYSGKIIRKGKFVNSRTQNISVFATINSNKNHLYNGMYLSASIKTKVSENVCKVPRRAIFSNNKVFIVDAENKLNIRTLKIISNQGNNVIVNNLQNNTILVSEPLINTKEGTIVNPIIK
ncbi:HlyD family efflux transporter periplasmic adaptor subunit [Flavobacteriales bacterium]|nr:HlyD family efflux transporter periplasmic adaptor subunit [Flavobacteriales bacterium]